MSYLPTLDVKHKASTNFANVTLASWDDYKTNYVPYRDMVFDSMTTENPGLVASEVDQAQGLVRDNFDTSQNNQRVTMSRLGMAPDAQTQQSMDRSSSLTKATSLAAAANKTRADLKDRDMAIMTTGVPNVDGRSYGMRSE